MNNLPMKTSSVNGELGMLMVKQFEKDWLFIWCTRSHTFN